jgi:ABC-2 type transport system permease protein
MTAILKRELIQFFTSPIGYIAMGMFFLLNSLFLWIIEGNYNIPNNQFADLSPFFNLAPWILIFVIAAVSMRSFSEEFKSGSIETLITKPIKLRDIVWGKFMSVWGIGKIILFPTLIYVFSVQALTLESQHLDWGVVISGYLGLALLIGAFASMGIFASLLFSNQVNAFLVGLLLMFLFYFGFEGIGNFNLFGGLDVFMQNLSLETHFQNMLKGLLKLSDVIYILSITALFVLGSIAVLKRKMQ